MDNGTNKKITRLEIGSGTRPTPGFTTVDIEPYSKADIIADFRTLSFSELEEIRAHHLLEHFSRAEGEGVLRLWHDWLKPGGILCVETPDFERICSLFASGGVWGDKQHMVQHAYGSQEAEWAFHKDGWYEDKFKEVLPKIGFEITLIKHKHSYIRYGEGKIRHRLPNILVIAKKK